MPSPRFPIPQGTLDMREAKFYCLTPAGRRPLAVEKDSWARLSGAVTLIFEEGSR
jgi:PadR family transcriptional regulator PadR